MKTLIKKGIHAVISRISAWLRRFADDPAPSVEDRRRAPRLIVRLFLSVSPIERRTGRRAESRLALVGYTRDLSEAGLGIFLPSIRIGKLKLSVGGQPLRIMLDLPLETIEMQAAVVRCVRLNEPGTGRGYLVGLKVIQINERHHALLSRYLKSLR